MNQNTFTELEDLMHRWVQLDYILPEDIPSIELYMDQVTTFMEKQLSGNKRYADDKILTKTMINNYSKNDLLPPSNKKKYSKDHIILLIYIYYLKNFLSISDIQNLLKPMCDNHFNKSNGLTMSDIYTHIFHLEQEYDIKLHDSIADIYDIANRQSPSENDYLKTFTMILLLSYDIYTKKQLVEKLIDSMSIHTITKEEAKAIKAEAKLKEKREKELARHKKTI